MDPFVLEATHATPAVNIDYQKGTILLTGQSHPEDALKFFKPVIQALDSFEELEPIDIVVDFKMLYFNTSTARCIFLILKELKKLERIGHKVDVNWYAEEDDLDMQETGSDFEVLTGIEINMILIKVEE